MTATTSSTDHGDPTTGPVAAAGAPATASENLLTLLGGTWLVIGLFIDGYAHSEIIDTETEDFFTPWHAIFYSGFLFTTAVVGWIAIRRSAPTPMTTWLPPGYGWAAAGVGIFAVGGIGDGIWHTVFGVETGIDALLSPTHLLLFTGMVLVLTAPVRSFWASSAEGGTWRSTGMAVGATAIATAVVVFFFTYAFGLGETGNHQVPFDPVTDAGEGNVSLGLSTGYVATVLLLAPLLVLLRRTDLPAGAIVVLWAVPSQLNDLAFDGAYLALPATVVGGIATEVALRGLGRAVGRRRAIPLALGLGMAVVWSTWLALAHVTEGVVWLPELWSGQIVISALLAMGLGFVAFPPSVPAGPEAPSPAS